MNHPPPFSIARLAAVLLAFTLVSACGSDLQPAGAEFVAGTPDVLTVATAFVPAPGFWDGTVEEPGGGFEAMLARELSERLGLGGAIRVVQVPFARLVAGDLGGADVALSQITPTEERDAALDFSIPYLDAPPGVLVRSDVTARDAAELRELNWAVSTTSTLTPLVLERIRPRGEPVEVEDRTAALEELRAGRADAVLLDLPVAQGLARAEPSEFTVVGHIGGGEGLAVALADGSPNREIVDSTLRGLGADGTIAELTDTWLGEDRSRVRYIRVAG